MRSKKTHATTGRRIGRPAMVDVQLTTAHNVNGIIYGADRTVTVVRVDENIAATLREQEYRTHEHEKYVAGSGAGIIIPGAGGRLQPVDPRYFDATYNAADPRIRISGR